MEKKMTKRDVLTAIAALVSADANITVNEVVVTGEDIIDYVNKTIEQLDNKATKARERAAEKKVEGDELRNAVAAVLTNDLQTIDQIVSLVDVEDVTKSKVTARLTALVKAGTAMKEQIKTEDGRKVMAYALISEDDDATIDSED